MDNSDFKEQLLKKLLPDNVNEVKNVDIDNQELKKLSKRLFWFIICLIIWIPLIIIIYSLSAFFTDKNILDFCNLCSLYILFFFYFLTILTILIPIYIIIRNGLKNYFSNELSKNEFKKFILNELINLHKQEKDIINIKENTMNSNFSNIIEENNKIIIKLFEDHIEKIKDNESRWNQIQTTTQSIFDLLKQQL